jgi:hypothetical protein
MSWTGHNVVVNFGVVKVPAISTSERNFSITISVSYVFGHKSKVEKWVYADYRSATDNARSILTEVEESTQR